MKNRLIAGHNHSVHNGNRLPCCTHGLPLERQRAGEPDDVILCEGFQVRDPAAL